MGAPGMFSGRGTSKRERYLIQPHHKLFPFKWYDVIKETYETDGWYESKTEREVIMHKVNKKTATGMKKLMKPT